MKKIKPVHIILFGFLFVILIGSVLLTLPISSKSGEATPYINALFTSTTSVCVTGLVVETTMTYWSTFGQLDPCADTAGRTGRDYIYHRNVPVSEKKADNEKQDADSGVLQLEYNVRPY